MDTMDSDMSHDGLEGFFYLLSRDKEIPQKLRIALALIAADATPEETLGVGRTVNAALC